MSSVTGSDRWCSEQSCIIRSYVSRAGQEEHETLSFRRGRLRDFLQSLAGHIRIAAVNCNIT
jgi:hypothetical protein